jgi:hypothetical protein
MGSYYDYYAKIISPKIGLKDSKDFFVVGDMPVWKPIAISEPAPLRCYQCGADGTWVRDTLNKCSLVLCASHAHLVTPRRPTA